MLRLNALIIVIIVVLIDLIATFTSIGWCSLTFQSAFRQLFTGKYNFFTNPIDFVLLAVIRSTILIAGACIVQWNVDGAHRLAQLSNVIGCTAWLMYAFSPTKLLAFAEENDAPSIGEYFCVIWNLIASFLLNMVWKYALMKSNRPTTTIDDEDTSLLIDEDETEDDHTTTIDDELKSADKASVDVIDVRQTFDLILRLLQYCRREWFWHLSGFSWLLLYSLTRIFVPYYTGQVIASVVTTKSYDELLDSVKVMSIISIASAICGGFRGGSFEYAYARVNRAIRRDLLTSLVHQEVAFYDAHKTGEVTSRLTSDCQTMSDTVALNVNVFLRNIVMLLGSMLFMMVLSWRLSLVTFIVVPIIFVASKIFGSYYDILSERTQDSVAKSNDVAEEVLSTMRTVRSFACENFEASRFHKFLSVTLQITRQKAIAYIGFIWVNELFQMFIIVAVLWYGGHLVITGKLKSDLLVSFLLYQMQLGDNLRQMGEVWTGLMQSVGASRKVFEYIDRKPAISNDGTYAPVSVPGRIEFRNVHLSYASRPDLTILNDLSFSVNPGETVALVGPSGGGKSSCIALLERFYEPSSGQLLIDGVPLHDYEHKFIHTKIALVGQEPVLFARSVSENIAYGLDNCSEEAVISAAKMANAHNFIVETRQGYRTSVGEKGNQMSGGQKQRIAIARALVRKPSILLLDEATSALDTESEHQVQEAIYRNLKGHSVILIAHRLSTVEKADRIIVINKGRVEQEGTHEQLLKQDGLYRVLVQRQMIGHADADGGTMTAASERKSDAETQQSTPSPVSMARSLLATSYPGSGGSSFQSR